MFRILFFCLFFLRLGAHGPAILFIGTRPEAIKMIPVYQGLKNKNIQAVICSTGQHAELLTSMFELFEVHPDYSFNLMKPGQDLTYITCKVLEKAGVLFEEIKPSMVIVQGDTTSALSAALAAFYAKIPIAHIEAGLRTANPNSPYPEEMNRRLISRLASYHFAPTEETALNLLHEGICPDSVFITGNTVVDSLNTVLKKIESGQLVPSRELVNLVAEQIPNQNRTLLLTAHRRESFDGGLKSIFAAIKVALKNHPHLRVIYPVHPNPSIQKLLHEMEMETLENLILLPPIPYHDFVYLLNQVDAVATDSGGIQEEGVSLNKRVLVLRNETDRPEGISRGSALLVGTSQEAILKNIALFMSEPHTTPDSSASVYGDGTAGEKIAEILERLLKK